MRRTDFFREGTAKGLGADWVGALAVANFYVFPLWSNHSQPLLPRSSRPKSFPVFSIPEITLELVRNHEITGNFHRCKNIFVNFCQRGRYGGNAELLPPSSRRTPRKALLKEVSRRSSQRDLLSDP